MAAKHADPEFVRKLDEQAAAIYNRGLADHFLYVGALRPELFRPLQRQAVTLTEAELAPFNLGFEGWLYLLQGAPDDCIKTLADRLRTTPTSWTLQAMLAAVMTPAALTAVADSARANPNAISAYEDMGFDIPDVSGPAEPRFFLQRSAIRIAPATDFEGIAHPVGLPPESVVDGSQPEIVWHYLTLEMGAISGAPVLPFQKVHLVGPMADYPWSRVCRVSAGDQYAVIDRQIKGRKLPSPDQGTGWAAATLIPYDDSLTYTNGHVFATDDVVGIVGGPPAATNGNPKCPDCKRQMLHLCAVSTEVREYGDGFRYLSVCERCRVATCMAVGSN